MKRGNRQPDNIGLMLDNMLDAGIRKKKFELLTDIKNDYHFRQLITSANGATQEDNDRLAHAILDTRWNNHHVGPVIEGYARKFIYPHRKCVQ